LTNPAEIGAAARGLLNFGDEPAYEAIVWRAVIAGNVGICASGGLLDDHYRSCAAAVSAGVRATSDGDLTVTVYKGS
jgi:hypothetical protein